MPQIENPEKEQLWKIYDWMKKNNKKLPSKRKPCRYCGISYSKTDFNTGVSVCKSCWKTYLTDLKNKTFLKKEYKNFVFREKKKVKPPTVLEITCKGKAIRHLLTGKAIQCDDEDCEHGESIFSSIGSEDNPIIVDQNMKISNQILINSKGMKWKILAKKIMTTS